TGAASSNVMLLTDEGRSISTFYTVHVDNILKGTLVAPDVTVIIPGGKVTFFDGTTAEIRTLGFFRPGPLRMAWFLTKAEGKLVRSHESDIGSDGAFVPVAGVLGIYDLTMTRGPFVLPAGEYTTKFAKDLAKQRLTPDQFISTVKAL